MKPLLEPTHLYSRSQVLSKPCPVPAERGLYACYFKEILGITLTDSCVGDKDYVPPVERLIADGMKVDVIFWDQAARELKDACSNFISLNRHLEILKPRVRENREDMLQTA